MGMISHIVFDIFGSFQMLTKFGTLDPLCIAEILHKIQDNPQNTLKT